MSTAPERFSHIDRDFFYSASAVIGVEVMGNACVCIRPQPTPMHFDGAALRFGDQSLLRVDYGCAVVSNKDTKLMMLAAQATPSDVPTDKNNELHLPGFAEGASASTLKTTSTPPRQSMTKTTDTPMPNERHNAKMATKMATVDRWLCDVMYASVCYSRLAVCRGDVT